MAASVWPGSGLKCQILANHQERCRLCADRPLTQVLTDTVGGHMPSPTEQDYRVAVVQLLEQGFKAKKLMKLIPVISNELCEERDEKSAAYEMGRGPCPPWYGK